MPKARFVLGVLGCALLSCVRRESDPPPPDSAPPPKSNAPLSRINTSSWEPIHGGWFELRAPANWKTLPLTTDRRRAMFALQLNSAKEDPDVLVIVSRPRPLLVSGGDAAANDASAPAPIDLAARFLNISQGRPPEAPTEKGTLAGQPAAIAGVNSRKPTGEPTSFATWAATLDQHLVLVMCGGTGRGTAHAALMCPDLIGSFRLTGPLVLPAPPAAAVDSMVAKTVGPVELRVPSTWEPLSADWFVPPDIGGFRSATPPTGPFEVALVQVAKLPARGGDSAAPETPVGSRVIKTRDVVLAVGPAVETEATDGAGTMTFTFDVRRKRDGYRLTCSVPERAREALRAPCEAMAKSLKVLAAE